MNVRKLYDRGLEKYPLGCVIGQNIFFLAYFAIGFIGMMPLQIHGFPVISVLYALFLFIMLIFVLRKHLCTSYYYYGKLCNTGWGKLSALVFGKDSGDYQLGAKLAGITWMLATFIPVIGIVIALLINYSLSNLLLLILFILLTPINFLNHRKACERCKMKLTCPASMVKSD